jgi:hypothetical protein
MKIIKAIWGSIVVLWIISIAVSLPGNVKYVQSAMQASQLYNEATTTFLGIIAVTVALNLWDSSGNSVREEIQKQVKYLGECVHNMSEVLNRLEQHKDDTVISTSGSQDSSNKVSQNIPSQLNILEQPNPLSSNPPRICSKCGAPLLIRTGSNDEYKGKQFYVCSNYPKCKEFLPV